MRKLLFLLLALAVLTTAGCKPPEPKADEAPRELTEFDQIYLHSRGLRPAEYNSRKALQYLKQRDMARQQVREAQKRQYERVLEKQKKAEAEKNKPR